MVELSKVSVLRPVKSLRSCLKRLLSLCNMAFYIALFETCTDGFHLKSCIISRNYFKKNKNTLTRTIGCYHSFLHTHLIFFLLCFLFLKHFILMCCCLQQETLLWKNFSFCTANNLLCSLLHTILTNTQYYHCFTHLFCDYWLVYYTFPLSFALFRKMETSRRSTSPMWSRRARRKLMPLSLNCSKCWDKDPLAR